jgi:RNA polymerase sigma-70 factor, ECF subfamily
MLTVPDTRPAAPPAAADQAWLDALRARGETRERAVAELHALLLRAARFEIHRRRVSLPHLRGDELDDIALQSADDALLAVLAKLDGYRGESRFTTWAYKFALLEAAVALRRRAWQGREIPLAPKCGRCWPTAPAAPRRRPSSASCWLGSRTASRPR